MSRTSRPLPPIPGQVPKKKLPPLPERPSRSSISVEDYPSFESSQKYLCTGKIPENLQGLRKSMILKMAESFGIDAKDRTHDNLCQLVDNSIKKSITMSEMNAISKDCVERLSFIRQNLSSKKEIGGRILEKVGSEIEELEKLQDAAQKDYNDRNVPDSQLRKYLARFRNCSQDTERITRKIEQYALEMSPAKTEIQRPSAPKTNAPTLRKQVIISPPIPPRKTAVPAQSKRAAQISRDTSEYSVSSSESPQKKKKFSFQDALGYASQGINFGKGVYDTFKK